MTGIVIGIIFVVIVLVVLIVIGLSRNTPLDSPKTKKRDVEGPSRGTRSRPHNAEERGAQGELEVNKILTSVARPQDKIIADVILFNENTGKSSQIDHIFITSSGVYVIETKNYSGYIYGTEREQQWTEMLAHGVKNQFYSPVKQNNTHLYQLRKIIGDKVPMQGLVVFTNGDIRNVKSTNVIKISELKPYLKSQAANLLSAEEMRTVYEKILQNKVSHCISKNEHLANIKKTQADLKNLICPRCGKQLVLRTGKFGEFYGCSGYPNCKFTLRKSQGDK